MAASLGNTKKAYIKISSTYTWLACEQSNSLNITQEAVETSDKSTAWAQFLAGKKGATAEITVFADNNDSAQKAALKGIFNGVSVDVYIGVLNGSTLTSGDAFNAIVTGVSDTNDFGAVSSRTISVTANGAVSHTPTLT